MQIEKTQMPHVLRPARDDAGCVLPGPQYPQQQQQQQETPTSMLEVRQRQPQEETSGAQMLSMFAAAVPAAERAAEPVTETVTEPSADVAADRRVKYRCDRESDKSLSVYASLLKRIGASYLTWDYMTKRISASLDSCVPAALPYVCVYVVGMWDQERMGCPEQQRADLQGLLDSCVSSTSRREARVLEVAPILDNRGQQRGLPSRYKFAAVVASSMHPDLLASVLHKRVQLDAHGAWHVAYDQVEQLDAMMAQVRVAAMASGSNKHHSALHDATLGLPSKPVVFEVAKVQRLARRYM